MIDVLASLPLCVTGVRYIAWKNVDDVYKWDIAPNSVFETPRVPRDSPVRFAPRGGGANSGGVANDLGKRQQIPGLAEREGASGLAAEGCELRFET